MSTVLMGRIGQVTEPYHASFQTREFLPPSGDKVLVQIRASAICGSDLHIFKGKHPSAQLPVTIGHELSGDVIAVGESTRCIKVGDRVTVEPVVVCGTCESCRSGEYGYCEKISYTYRNGDGGLADYIQVPEACVHPLPEELSYEEGALIEPLSVAVHAVRRADIRLGDQVLVIGAGAIGLLVAALCRRCGAAQVVSADQSRERLHLAMELGATSVIDIAQEDPTQAMPRLTNNRGFDKTFECVGLESTFRQAMFSLRRGGLATIAGIFEQSEITVPAARFVTHEIRVQGTQGYCRDFPVAIQLAKEIGLKRLITHTMALDDLQHALETCLDQGSKAVKVVLKP